MSYDQYVGLYLNIPVLEDRRQFLDSQAHAASSSDDDVPLELFEAVYEEGAEEKWFDYNAKKRFYRTK